MNREKELNRKLKKLDVESKIKVYYRLKRIASIIRFYYTLKNKGIMDIYCIKEIRLKFDIQFNVLNSIFNKLGIKLNFNNLITIL